MPVASGGVGGDVTGGFNLEHDNARLRDGGSLGLRLQDWGVSTAPITRVHICASI